MLRRKKLALVFLIPVKLSSLTLNVDCAVIDEL